MSKTANIFARVEPEVKEGAEAILDGLGISMSNAVSMFLKQVIIHKGIPFEVKLPKNMLNLDNMTEEELNAALEEGYAEYKAGKAIPAEQVFEELHREFGI